jgi:hypothetical protein
MNRKSLPGAEHNSAKKKTLELLKLLQLTSWHEGSSLEFITCYLDQETVPAQHQRTRRGFRSI